MRVHVDQSRCQGHTLCAMRAPAVFELSDMDGHSSAIGDEVPAGQEENVRNAVDSCPEQAISLSQ